MKSEIQINKELNFAASVVLLDVISQNYSVQIENIVISNDDFYVQFASKEAISSNDLERLENLVREELNSEKKIFLALKKHELNKYEKYYNEHNPKNLGEFYQFNNSNIFSFGNKVAVPYDVNNIKFFKLISIGGAKWLKNDNNENLVRISAVAFASVEEGANWIAVDQERKERDHRKIGEDLKIFKIDSLAGQGLPIWLPRGFRIRNALSKFINHVEFKYHFRQVATPVLGSVNLYKTSGHYFHYRENMFPEIHLPDGEEAILRPMTCPHHILVYRDTMNSYKDLPIRISEDAILHRYEYSGGLTGLERVRMMTLADIHIFARMDQIKSEIKRTYEMLKEVHHVLDIKFSSVDLSLHDPNDREKFFDNPEMWKTAEGQLRQALEELHIPFNEEIGEAAFYGPKIDFQAETALGHIVTVSTMQLDFLLPERFQLTYKDKDNNDQRPVMIHVSTIGTYERFVAVLLEQTKGKLPLWLSPDQVAIIPVNEDCLSYCEEIDLRLRDLDIRTVIDASDERLSKRIRDAQVLKIPYQLVIGEKEKTAHNVAVRKYGSEETIFMTLEDFIQEVKKGIEEYK